MEPLKKTLKIPAHLAQGHGEVCVGIDEAGRGPVLGPMVYACAFWLASKQGDFQKSEFDDSKKLTDEGRRRMFQRIRDDDDIGYAIGELSARSLSEQMLRVPESVSLNRIAQDATVELLKTILDAGVKVREIYVDALGNCEIYEKYLSEAFPGTIVTVKPKADSLFKVVSAASICAKVRRDESLENWEFRENLDVSKDWGCGYPGDEKTKNWLVKNVDKVFGYPEVVRFSWQTTKNLLEVHEGKSATTDAVTVSFLNDQRGTGQNITALFKRVKHQRPAAFGGVVLSNHLELGKI